MKRFDCALQNEDENREVLDGLLNSGNRINRVEKVVYKELESMDKKFNM